MEILGLKRECENKTIYYARYDASEVKYRFITYKEIKETIGRIANAGENDRIRPERWYRKKLNQGYCFKVRVKATSNERR